LSCRPEAGTGVLQGLIIFLLGDSTSTSEECRLVTAHDQPVQLDQRRKVDACRTHCHASARHRINHPPGNGHHGACRSQNLQKLTCCPSVDATNADLLAEIGMPAVENLNLIADMGRMNG
jgi:hypothetical protein